MTTPALSPSLTTTQHPIPVYIHLASLDAPLVAALWSTFFAAAAHRSLPITAPLSLALGVWVLYIADRLLDSTTANHLEARHLFHARHARAFLLCIAAATALLLWIIPHHMPAEVRNTYLPLGILLAVYFFAVHSSHLATLKLPKELIVGLFFGAATAVPLWARAPELRPWLVPAAALFAALCWLNCKAITDWEAGNHTTGSQLPLAATIVSIAAFVLILLALTTHLYPLAFTSTACLLSALILLALHHHRRRFTRLNLRIAADAALLTPLLLLPFLL